MAPRPRINKRHRLLLNARSGPLSIVRSIFMGQIAMSFLPPEYWQDFQRLTVDVCAFKWPRETVHEYGREGQAQDGVDVHVYDSTEDYHVGIQCKRRRQYGHSGRVLAGGVLTKKEIEEEIAKAEQFAHSLGLYIIATTAL